jgi:hypothetical protein
MDQPLVGDSTKALTPTRGSAVMRVIGHDISTIRIP